MWIARALVPVILVSVASIASACTALTGADSLVAEDTRAENASTDGGSSGTSGTTPTPGEDAGGSSSGSDATTTAPDSGTPTNPNPDPNTVALDAKFDTAEGCSAWTVSNGTRSHSTTLGRTAAGACVLCAAGPGAYLERISKAPVAGKLNIVSYARRPPDKTLPAKFTFTAISSNGTLSTSQTFDSNATWTQAGTGVKVGVQKDESITVRFSLPEALKDECIVVDDVLVFIQ